MYYLIADHQTVVLILKDLLKVLKICFSTWNIYRCISSHKKAIEFASVTRSGFKLHEKKRITPETV